LLASGRQTLVELIAMSNQPETKSGHFHAVRFYKDAAVEDANIDEMCRHHTHVVKETGTPAPVN